MSEIRHSGSHPPDLQTAGYEVRNQRSNVAIGMEQGIGASTVNTIYMRAYRGSRRSLITCGLA